MSNNNRTGTEVYVRMGEDEFDLQPVTTEEPFPVKLPDKSFAYMTGLSAANTALTLTTPAAGQSRRLNYVLTHYSAAPTQTGVVVSVIPAVGAAYTTAISIGSANVQDNQYVPGAPLYLLPGDRISVLAPAAGGVVTAAIVIAWEWV